MDFCVSSVASAWGGDLCSPLSAFFRMSCGFKYCLFMIFAGTITPRGSVHVFGATCHRFLFVISVLLENRMSRASNSCVSIKQ